MSVIGEFSLPREGFVLGDALDLDEIERIEFDCNIPAQNDVMPYFWVWGRHFDRFETRAEREPAIDKLTSVDELDGVRLYRAEWRAYITHLLEAAHRSNSEIKTLAGTMRWTVELRFDQLSDVSTFTKYYTDTGIELELQQLYSLHRSPDAHDTLTPAQREALRTAEQEGFYNEPRNITMEDLADKFDVSLAAMSGRLRRGTSNLIRSTLL